MPKLIICDISGIITNRGEVNREILKSLKALKKTKYTFATGKGFLSVKKDLDGFVPEYLLVENGALIITNKGVVLNSAKFTLNKKLIESYYFHENFEFLACVDIETQRYNFLCKDEKIRMEVMGKDFYFANEATVDIEQFFRIAGSTCVRIIIKMSQPIKDISFPSFDGYEYSISETFFINICKSKVNKAYAIKILCNLLNINLNDAMCFGNDYNDIVMFELPIEKVLVKSNNNIPKELISLADEIININDMPNCINYIEK